jgi:hypothetical protein
MRFALYIKSLGETPLPLQHRSYRKYAAALGQQYQGLKVQHGREQANKGQALARAEIRKLTLRVAAIDLVPDIPPTLPKVRSKKTGIAKNSNPRSDLWNCRRKLSHSDYLSALLHARGLPGHLSKPVLNIYPCNVCGGLHVGRSRRQITIQSSSNS